MQFDSSGDRWLKFLIEPTRGAPDFYEKAFKAAMTVTKMPVVSVMRSSYNTYLRILALADKVGIGYRPGEELPIAEMLEAEVLKKREPIAIPDLALSPFAHHSARMRYGIRSFIGAPIFFSDGSIFGVISSVARQPFPLGKSELLKFSMIAQWLSQNIELKRIHKELNSTNKRVIQLSQELETLKAQSEERSIRDPLTNLYNNRRFLETLQKEVSRAMRFSFSVSLLLLSPDGLHQIARNRGADAVNAVFRTIAVLLRRHLRNIDEAFRYTAELFSILLSQTDLQGAYIVAERILSTISKQPFIDPHTGDTFHLSASIGIACTSKGEVDPANNLLSRATTAIEKAKNSGGNRIVAVTIGTQSQIYALPPSVISQIEN